MKQKIVLLSIILFVVLANSCAPGTAAPAAIPTATTLPIVTPTPAPATLTDLPDLSTWVEEFVHAYGGKVTINGVEMNAEQ